jgi:hypothetical protein
MRDIFSGLVYINHGTTGAEIQFPFGGVRGTGNGTAKPGRPHRKCSPNGSPFMWIIQASCNARRSITGTWKMSRKTVFLTLAIVGFIAPYYFFLQVSPANGFDLPSLFQPMFANNFMKGVPWT